MTAPYSQVLKIVFAALLAAWGLGMLSALWWKPALQRWWVFRPRWRGGLRASRGGATVQVLFVFCVIALIVCDLIGVRSSSATTVFVTALAANFIAWVVDGANAAARES
ncbi:hypothetical protein LVB77_11755 [Lysobacter sp. 5GHs7-4]|uniref:hypothetical protein n=1 Tax=Lysobacter sp. 5GHs7-4 TaxID=2904253 RepID=UPI001E36AA3A|nr:hypothetical protein [Lysobacter sp. 5GHs7-4]UHQ21364.1 hypothetical protein LVB77_11755 [Lysobacter sp. 5GHs7-4]